MLEKKRRLCQYRCCLRLPVSPNCALQQKKDRGEGRGDKERQETYSDAESAEEWRDGRFSTCAGGSVEVDKGIVSFNGPERGRWTKGKRWEEG
jgi:hypothetical protein